MLFCKPLTIPSSLQKKLKQRARQYDNAHGCCLRAQVIQSSPMLHLHKHMLPHICGPVSFGLWYLRKAGRVSSTSVKVMNGQEWLTVLRATASHSHPV